MEDAGLDYEKVWYKVLGQVIYHWRAKQWYIKLHFWNYMNYYNYMNKLEFLFAIYKYLKASLFQSQGVVTILQVGIAKTG